MFLFPSLKYSKTFKGNKNYLSHFRGQNEHVKITLTLIVFLIVDVLKKEVLSWEYYVPPIQKIE